ncbi:MAG: exoribonuclease II, partial [Deltaproteobacteria bacterium]|nr:exoribonuclease II [Deltaproteobacteria bacterium]
MEIGTVVEYIERKRIVCAAVLQAKKHKLMILTQGNREASIPEGRVLVADGKVSLALGREAVSAELSRIAQKREALKGEVDVAELWEVLHDEAQWVDAPTMAGLA